MLNSFPVEPFHEAKLPPCNIDAEEAILGSLLIDPQAIARIIDLLPSPKAFYLEAHQHIYAAILDVHRRHEVTDLMQVSARLRDTSKLTDIGGQLKLAQLVDRCISSANIDAHARLVADKWLRRRLGASARSIEQLALRIDLPLPEVFLKAEEQIFSVTQQLRTGSAVPISEVAATAFSEIEKRSQGLVSVGIESGFHDLDAMTQGFQRGDLVIIAGRPAMGKSTFAAGIALHVGHSLRLPVLLCGLEMSNAQTFNRMLSSISEIDSGRLRVGAVKDHEWASIGAGVNRLGESLIFLDDDGGIDVAGIASKARELRSTHGDLGLVVVDYLQLMEGNGSDQSRVMELSKITRAFKRLAGELNVPILLLSQLNRGVESRTNKRPMMSDLKESGSIEQDSDLILMLYREEYYNPDTPDRNIAEVIVSKHRNGPTGTVKLLFQPEFTKFLNRARGAVL